MPSRLYFSNSLEALADRLIQGLDGTDPFDAPAIATPTPALRGWLQIHIAEKKRIAANLDFQPLETLLWKRLAELDHFRDDPDRQPARILDAMNFQGLILTQLRTNPPVALQEYLNPEDGEPYDEARRLCQLAGRLAVLFREYEYSRVTEGGFRGLTETWSRGETCFEQYLLGPKFTSGQREQVRKLEEWQRELYQALFRRGGLRDCWGEATNVYRYTLPQYAEMVLSQKRSPFAASPKVGTEEKVFHLFGLSHISPFHRALIHRLGEADILGKAAARFQIYALNPCEEYWEDMRTSRERLTREELQAEELPGDPGENALLSRFGKPGRETIKLWNQITDYDFLGDFQEPENDTVLATVQRAILHRSKPLPPEQRKAQDPSLQIWSAPDRHAEVEAVKAHIVELLLAEPLLQLEDIAVIPADFEAYLPVIEAGFDGGKKAGMIPYCLTEAGLLLESDLLRGFRDLLELASGPFRRNALLAWLENPAVQKRLRLNPALIHSFGKFLEDSGFQEGWDEEHQQQQGSVPGSPSTVEAATQRALLGFILDASDPALETAGLHPAADAIAGWDREEISLCLELLEDLRRDLRPFRLNETLPIEEWSQRLRHLLESYLKADPDQALEIQAGNNLRRLCADLEQWSSLKDGEGFSHHTLSVLIEDHFREPRTPRTSFLSGGVRVGSLSSLRSLPFRHVYMLGFNSGDFPSQREASPLDLRGYRRVIGEADQSSRDLYAFLEIVSATSDRLILSYVRRDAAKDSVRQPSHALAGLITYLESDVLIETQIKDKETLTVFTLLELDADATRKLLKSTKPVPTPPSWAALPTQEKPVLELHLLAAYLENPVEHACFDHFHLRKSLEGEENDEAPPLFLDKWETLRLLAPVLRKEWIRPGEGGAAVRHALQKQLWSGKGPSQPYADLEIERVEKETRDLLEGSIQELREYADNAGLRFAGTLRLGGQGKRPLDPPFLDRPVFDAAPVGISAQIGGMLSAFFSGSDPDNGWGFLLGSWDRETLQAYVFHLCVTALDVDKFFNGPGYLLFSESAEVFRLPSLDPEFAITSLRALLGDFQGAPDFDHLPLRVIEKITGKSDPDAALMELNWKEIIEEREREEEESSFTPLKRRQRILRAIGPEVPVDATAKIRRRILPYLDWRDGWKKIAP